MFDNKYPYTDFHELNLDWFMGEFKEYYTQIDSQNQKITTMEETVEQFTTFVTNYFDNLDVQQEINNKLDAMAASGELQAMLQPYFDGFVGAVNDQITTQNQRIDALDARMDTFTTLTEGSTTGDAELADIRAGYNGVTYSTAGDAVRHADASANALTQVNTINMPVDGGYIQSNGNYSPTRSFNNIYTPDYYDGKACVVPELGYQVAIAYYSKTDRSFVSRTNYSTVPVLTNDSYYWRITIASVTGVNPPDPPEDVLTHCIISYSPDIIINYILNDIAQPVLNMERGWSTHTTEAMKSVVPHDFETGDTITPKTGYEVALILPNGNNYRQWTPSVYTFDEDITVYVLIRKGNYNSDFLETSAPLSRYVEEIYYNTPETLGNVFTLKSTINNRKWYNKKAAFIGDSITAGTGTTAGNIYYQILNSIEDFNKVYADGVAGSCYSVTSNYGSGITPISQRYSNIPVDSDLVVIFAGTNDYGHNTPLGTIADTTDISFYGAVNLVIDGIKTANPDVTLVLMTPTHRHGFSGTYPDETANGQGHTLKDYVDAIKASAEKYSIPVIDLYSNVGFTPEIAVQKTNFVPDGLHPNSDGHHKIADYMSGVLEYV